MEPSKALAKNFTKEEIMKGKAVFFVVGLVFCVFASLIFFPINSLAQQKPMIIKFAHQLTESFQVAKQARFFETCVKEKSKGNVVIEVYPAAQLFGARDLLAAVRKGGVEMAAVDTPHLQGAFPLTGLFEVPFLFSTYDQVKSTWYGYPGEIFKEDFEKGGMKMVSPGYYGFLELSNSKLEIKTPKDLQGLKIRNSGPMNAEIIKSFGAAPVTLGGEEMYLALARKVADGNITGLTGMSSRKIWEVQKYLTLIHVSYVDIPMFINLQFWKTLPKEVQALIEGCAKESEEFVLKECIKDEKESLRILQEKGMLAYTPTPAEMGEFRKISAPVKEAWIKKQGDVGAKMVQFIESMK